MHEFLQARLPGRTTHWALSRISSFLMMWKFCPFSTNGRLLTSWILKKVVFQHLIVDNDNNGHCNRLAKFWLYILNRSRNIWLFIEMATTAMLNFTGSTLMTNKCQEWCRITCYLFPPNLVEIFLIVLKLLAFSIFIVAALPPVLVHIGYHWTTIEDKFVTLFRTSIRADRFPTLKQ